MPSSVMMPARRIPDSVRPTARAAMDLDTVSATMVRNRICADYRCWQTIQRAVPSHVDELLLGILREPASLTATILCDHGVGLPGARRQPQWAWYPRNA